MHRPRGPLAAPAVAAAALIGCYDLDKLRGPAVDCGSAIVCDDFESGALDPSTWTAHATNGAVTVDGTRAHSGARALHVHLDARPANAVGRATIETTRPFPLPALYARAYLWAQMGIIDYDILYVVPAAADFTRGVSVWRDDGYAQINLMELDNDTGGKIVPGAQSSPADEWHCIEWEVTNLDGASGATGITRVWVDGGMSVEDLMAPNASTPAFDSFLVGARNVRDYPEGALEFWIDDVAVARERIGCAP